MHPEIKKRLVGIIIIVVFVAVAIPFLLAGSRKKAEESTAADLQLPVSAEKTAVAVPQASNDAQSATVAASNISGNTTDGQQPMDQSPNTSMGATSTSAATLGLTTTSDIAAAATTNAAPDISRSISSISSSTDVNAAVGRVDRQGATAGTTVAQDFVLQRSINQKQAAIISQNKTTKNKKPTSAATAVVGKHVANSKHNIQHAIIATSSTKANVEARNATANNGWVIKIGSFTDKKRAQSLIKKLKSKGYIAYAKKTQIAGGEFEHVFVSTMEQKKGANDLAKKLEKMVGIECKAVKNTGA